MTFISKLTAVTCYYNLNSKSKYNHQIYLEWMQNMLKFMSCGLVIFTDEENYEIIKNFRIEYNQDFFFNRTLIIKKDFKDLKMYNFINNWESQLNIDPEKQIHSKELYCIWNEKINFIKEAYEKNPFNSDWFIWLDIGSCRNRDLYHDITPSQLLNWPNLNKLENIPQNQITFCKTNLNFMPTQYEIYDNKLTHIDLKNINSHVGGLFLLYKNYINEFHILYYNMLNEYKLNNRFFGKDQNILCNILIAYPEKVNLLIPNYGDVYFFLYQYLI
jgi:hypothetical protein